MRERTLATTLTKEAAEVLEIPEVRVDGLLKTTGRARYAADVYLPGTLWAKFLPSPHLDIQGERGYAAGAGPPSPA